jgi:hypothetical protein
MSNKKVDGTLCFFRHTQGNNTGKLVSVAVDLEKEEDRKQFIPLFRSLLKYPEFVRAMGEYQEEFGEDGEYFVVSIDGEIEENDFICDGCGKKCESKEKKIIITKQLSGVVMCEECSGGNTTERVEEQATRLEKIAEQKEINKVVDQVESAAIKAVHKVMEQHSKALKKLAESEE